MLRLPVAFYILGSILILENIRIKCWEKKLFIECFPESQQTSLTYIKIMFFHIFYRHLTFILEIESAVIGPKHRSGGRQKQIKPFFSQNKML